MWPELLPLVVIARLAVWHGGADARVNLMRDRVKPRRENKMCADDLVLLMVVVASMIQVGAPVGCLGARSSQLHLPIPCPILGFRKLDNTGSLLSHQKNLRD